jgi:hypothetical protein
MGHTIGRVSEIRLGSGKNVEICVVCPESVVPDAGQYVLAFDLDDPDAVLSIPLFMSEKYYQGFWGAPLFPVNWAPGTKLNLVGPLGHGFNLPRNIHRLGLVTDLSLPRLTAALEAYPLSSLKDSLDWPDFLALDVPLETLSELRATFGFSNRDVLPCPAQGLVTTPIPCAGMAQCGACAVPARRGWKLVCEDGPVFDINTLKW